MNYEKGQLGEQCVQQALQLNGVNINSHDVRDKGLDITAYTSTHHLLVGEVINWRNGYIHNSRFNSILENLFNQHSQLRTLFCCGGKPTSEQQIFMNQLNITLFTLPTVTPHNFKQSVQLLDKLIQESVITHTNYNSTYTVNDSTFTLTNVLDVADDFVVTSKVSVSSEECSVSNGFDCLNRVFEEEFIDSNMKFFCNREYDVLEGLHSDFWVKPVFTEKKAFMC